VERVEEPVFWQWHEVGRIHKYSDTLLIFTMKGAMPERLRENLSLDLNGRVKHTGISVSMLNEAKDEIEVRP